MGLSVVQWVGGKGQQLGDLLPLIPYSRGYAEPFGGGAVVLMSRRRSPCEVYNDLNQNVVALFRQFQTREKFEAFEARLAATMWSRDEFRKALALQAAADTDEADRAWATYVIQNQGISGSHSKSEGNWSRSFVDAKNTEKWWRRHERLEQVYERFKNVQIDSVDALQFMAYWDAPDMVFYVDPPYVLDTRGDRSYYEYELTLTQHEQLVEVLLQLEGAVVLSGYDHEVYKPLLAAGWEPYSYEAHAYARIVSAEKGEEKPDRVEAVWRNKRCLELAGTPTLF